jgi:hypothetical protein
MTPLVVCGSVASAGLIVWNAWSVFAIGLKAGWRVPICLFMSSVYLLLAIMRPWWSLVFFLVLLFLGPTIGRWLRKTRAKVKASLTEIQEAAVQRDVVEAQ